MENCESYKSKKYYIKTFGCQANVADSNTMAGILESLNFERYQSNVKHPNDEAELEEVFSNVDLVIINTCSIRQKSEDKVYGMGRVLKKVQENYKSKPFVVLSGCMVGSVSGDRKRYEFTDLEKKTPWVDLYTNPSQLFSLPNFLYEKGVLDEWALKKFDPNKVTLVLDSLTSAFVNVSYGCDNFCTFCVVPYARGAETSRSKEDILREVNHLVSRGINEITLCGQNVNSWGLPTTVKFEIRTGSDQKLPFADLLREICSIDKINIVNFISSNPFDFTSDLIDALKSPKISNYLHIAVQSGNNEVLKKMNRRHTVESFIDLVSRIKKEKPAIELGTDIIVGFPGETEEQFMDTVELFKKVPFNVAYISIYSPRKGTPAERFYKDDISLKEKKRRHAYLTDVWKKTKPKRNE